MKLTLEQAQEMMERDGGSLYLSGTGITALTNSSSPRMTSSISSSSSASVIRIRAEIYDEICRLSEISRTPVSDIASDAIAFALRHNRLSRADCYDVTFTTEKEEGAN